MPFALISQSLDTHHHPSGDRIVVCNHTCAGRELGLQSRSNQLVPIRSEEQTHIPSAVGARLTGYPEWVEGGIGLVFATLFLSPLRYRAGGWEHVVYRTAVDAHELYMDQLDYYQRLEEEFPHQITLLRSRQAVTALLHERRTQAPSPEKVGLVICMEEGDAIRSPEEVEDWQSSCLTTASRLRANVRGPFSAWIGGRTDPTSKDCWRN